MKEKHTKKTLMSWTKKELTDYCIILEHNNMVKEQLLNFQYYKFNKLLNEMEKK